MGGAVHLLLADGGINVSGLTTLVEKLIGLLVTVAGGGILLRVHGQRNFAAAAGAFAVVLLGLSVVGLSISGTLDGVAKGLASLIF